MAPPRFVKCNSTSPFASVSVFSTKGAIDSLGDGEGEVDAVSGAAEALGPAEAAGVVSVVRPGVGLGWTGAGGGKCVAVYAYQPMRPRTQREMAIQAWRSIISARRAIHNVGAAFAPRLPRSSGRKGPSHIRVAELGRARGRPMGCSGPTGRDPARSRAKTRAFPRPGESRPSTSVQTGSRPRVPREARESARAGLGNRE